MTGSAMDGRDRMALTVVLCAIAGLGLVVGSGLTALPAPAVQCVRQIGEYGLVAMKKAPDGHEVECHYVKRGPKAARNAAKAQTP